MESSPHHKHSGNIEVEPFSKFQSPKPRGKLNHWTLWRATDEVIPEPNRMLKGWGEDFHDANRLQRWLGQVISCGIYAGDRRWEVIDEGKQGVVCKDIARPLGMGGRDGPSPTLPAAGRDDPGPDALCVESRT
jgi:hypothetical protein